MIAFIITYISIQNIFKKKEFYQITKRLYVKNKVDKNTMNIFEFLGMLAAILTTSAFLPQVYKTWKTKDTKALSLTMYSSFLVGVLLWIVYGVYLNSLPMILANVVTAISVVVLIGLKLKYK